MALCVAGLSVSVRIATLAFTLAWTHTVEKLPWQENWRIEDGRLVLEEVRIKGSGAGMEPPPDARLVDGWYAWNPPDETRAEIVLRRSAADGVGDWTLCTEADGCRPLGDIVPENADPVVLSACP